MIPIFPKKIEIKSEDFMCICTNREVYIPIPITHPWAKKEEHEIPLDVHGGVTWSEEKLPWDEEKKDMWFIGWDYNHYCNTSDAFIGKSYGKIYDESSQKQIIEEAFIVMNKIKQTSKESL